MTGYELPREKATQEADLPHAYESWNVKPVCKLCRLPEGDQRHVAWEQNKEQAAEYPTLPREQG